MKTLKNLHSKKKVAEGFQKFPKENLKTHLEAFLTILIFFQYNQISPRENLGFMGTNLKYLIKKRTAGIAIIRNIEINAINPALGMIQTLFDGVAHEKEEEPLIVEKKKFDQSLLVNEVPGRKYSIQFSKRIEL